MLSMCTTMFSLQYTYVCMFVCKYMCTLYMYYSTDCGFSEQKLGTVCSEPSMQQEYNRHGKSRKCIKDWAIHAHTASTASRELLYPLGMKNSKEVLKMKLSNFSQVRKIFFLVQPHYWSLIHRHDSFPILSFVSSYK